MTNDLTLEEKMSGAVGRAKLQTAEKHFFDAAQPFFPLGFSIGYRNPGHWDIYSDRPTFTEEAHNATQPEQCHQRIPANGRTRERSFTIRGEPGAVSLYDHRHDPHRPHPRGDLTFRSVMAAMVYICEELMQEPKHADD